MHKHEWLTCESIQISLKYAYMSIRESPKSRMKALILIYKDTADVRELSKHGKCIERSLSAKRTLKN